MYYVIKVILSNFYTPEVPSRPSGIDFGQSRVNIFWCTAVKTSCMTALRTQFQLLLATSAHAKMAIA
eukprot:1588085-Amphidinium_carterae.1